jgi:hypothetical protein
MRTGVETTRTRTRRRIKYSGRSSSCWGSGGGGVVVKSIITKGESRVGGSEVGGYGASM